jgi:DNA polymerase III epsilon subunit-like protein
MLVVLDTETTGLGEDAQIVSIAAVMLNNTEGEDTILTDCIVHPVRNGWQTQTETAVAFALNGLTIPQVEQAQKFLPFVWWSLVSMLRKGPTRIIAHNAAFDLRLMRQSLAYLEPVDCPAWVCSKSLPWPTESRSLDAICAHYQVTATAARHSAYGDCARLIAAMRCLHRDVGGASSFLDWLETHPWTYAT